MNYKETYNENLEKYNENLEKYNEDKAIIEKYIRKLKTIGTSIKIEYNGDKQWYNKTPWIITEFNSVSKDLRIEPPRLKYNTIMLDSNLSIDLFLINNPGTKLSLDFSNMSLEKLDITNGDDMRFSLRKEIDLLFRCYEISFGHDNFELSIDIEKISGLVKELIKEAGSNIVASMSLLVSWIQLKIYVDSESLLDQEQIANFNAYEESVRLKYSIVGSVYVKMRSIDIFTESSSHCIVYLINELFRVFQGASLIINNSSLTFNVSTLDEINDITESLEDLLNGIIIRDRGEVIDVDDTFSVYSA
jgi:hypothetical protein